MTNMTKLVINVSVDGGLSEWSQWGECTVSCGTGSQTRSRDCSHPAPQYGGNDCSGPLEEIQACNTHSCPGMFIFPLCCISRIIVI